SVEGAPAHRRWPVEQERHAVVRNVVFLLMEEFQPAAGRRIDSEGDGGGHSPALRLGERSAFDEISLSHHVEACRCMIPKWLIDVRCGALFRNRAAGHRESEQ